MFGIENFFLFLGTGILLNLYPGPDTLYILGRSISQGRGAGIAAAFGISTGGVFHTVLGAFGLSALLATSANAFFTMKILGCLYLVYQGISMLISSNNKQIERSDRQKKLKLTTIFRQGAITNILNPKVAIFFLAFLPQFISTGSETKPLAFLVLGAVFITTGTIVCLLVALFSSAVSKNLRSNSTFSTWLLRVNGVLFTFLGIRLATLDIEV